MSMIETIPMVINVAVVVAAFFAGRHQRKQERLFREQQAYWAGFKHAQAVAEIQQNIAKGDKNCLTAAALGFGTN